MVSHVLQQRTITIDQHRVMGQGGRHHHRSLELLAIHNEFLQPGVVTRSECGEESYLMTNRRKQDCPNKLTHLLPMCHYASRH